MFDDYSDNFNRVFEDSARMVMAVVSGEYGIELQCFDRDISTQIPIVAFLVSDDKLTEFMLGRINKSPGVLYLAGCTIADIEHQKLTGERLAGIKTKCD